MTSGPVLKVNDLSLTYLIRQGEVKAVQDVSFELARGQSLGLVGESGCGKSSVANCLMGLLPDNARVTRGQVILQDQDLLRLNEDELRQYRWRRIAMVFQAAMNVLDPVYRVGQQIVEALEAHGFELSDAEAKERVADLFRRVGLDPRLMDRYPHEFSGGMRQRAVIAMALSCDPGVIIADEPTTALDVIVQDKILRELKDIQNDREMAVIYITHDIAVVAEVTDLVAVMYRRPHGGAGTNCRRNRRAPSPIHGGVDVVFPQRERRKAAADSSLRRTSQPGESPGRLSVPSEMRKRNGRMPDGVPAPGIERWPLGRLLASSGGVRWLVGSLRWIAPASRARPPATGHWSKSVG